MWAPRRCARLLSRDPSPRATDRRPFRLTSRGTILTCGSPSPSPQVTEDFAIQPEKVTPTLDASKWPLLLKNYDKLMVRARITHRQFEPTEGSREGFAADGPREKKQDASPDRFATPDSTTP